MDDEPEQSYAPSAKSLSKTPSWIMLGFVFGAVFVWMLPPREPAPAPLPVIARLAPPEPARTTRGPVTTIEAVWAEWGNYAVWDRDTTEVAFDSGTGQFSDCYEVKRAGDAVYFRSIPRLTRRVLTHGKLPDNSPLQFTETEAQYRDWVQFGRTERPTPPGLAPGSGPAPAVPRHEFPSAVIESRPPPPTPSGPTQEKSGPPSPQGEMRVLTPGAGKTN